MKIVFFGTPDFAIPSLRKIFESGHQINAVVTAPDKVRGRGNKILFSDVKNWGIENNVPVLQPEFLKDEKFREELIALNADLFIVVAFRILPQSIFTIPKYGSFNLHGSLLPKYRGAAPIQWALINGEKETGLTTFKLEEKVDTGNIYLQKKILIDDNDDAGSLFEKMSLLGAELVIETIEMIEKNNFTLISQDNSLASPAPKITKDLCPIDWRKTAFEIHNLVRGLSPSPTAFFLHNEKILKVYKTKINNEIKLNSGEIYQADEDLIIGCGKGALSILELQLEGKKRLPIKEFLRGYNFLSKSK